MSNPYLGQIEVFGFGFAPKNWVQCRGQILPIQQYQALFALLGTTYGGNGVTTFALPDLQGRVPVGVGRDPAGVQWTWGQKGGTESIVLQPSQIAAHTHQVKAAGNTDVSKNTNAPSNTVGLGQSTGTDGSSKTMPMYAFASGSVTSNYVALHASAVSTAGSSQPHENRMPSLVMNFCISLAGVFPSRN
ncbi:MAG TPA: tail fiber protein [Reyranella sp.]|jgi:microcystin-dependent protein